MSGIGSSVTGRHRSSLSDSKVSEVCQRVCPGEAAQDPGDERRELVALIRPDLLQPRHMRFHRSKDLVGSRLIADAGSGDDDNQQQGHDNNFLDNRYFPSTRVP
jgi:hypothetical protein